jgi:hypothetical protein
MTSPREMKRNIDESVVLEANSFVDLLTWILLAEIKPRRILSFVESEKGEASLTSSIRFHTTGCVHSVTKSEEWNVTMEKKMAVFKHPTGNSVAFEFPRLQLLMDLVKNDRKWFKRLKNYVPDTETSHLMKIEKHVIPEFIPIRGQTAMSPHDGIIREHPATRKRSASWQISEACFSPFLTGIPLTTFPEKNFGIMYSFQ